MGIFQPQSTGEEMGQGLAETPEISYPFGCDVLWLVIHWFATTF